MKSDSQKQSKNFKLFGSKIYRMLGGMAGVILLFILLICLSLFFLTLFFGDGGLTLITPEYKAFS